MGDDRPSVYQREDGEGGLAWVYRASALGHCERALRYARKETPGRELFGSIRKVLDQSSDLEDAVISWFETQYDIKVHDRQMVVEIEVAPGVWVRGSIDGRGVSALGGQQGLFEAKAFGDEYWEVFNALGMQGFPGYVSQFHTYCEGLRQAGYPVEGGWFVVGKKAEGGQALCDLKVEWVPYKRAEWAKARATVLRVEKWADSDDRMDTLSEVECSGSVVCNYWYLHEKPPVPEVEDLLVTSLMTRLDTLKMRRDAVDAEIEETKAKIEAAVVIEDGVKSVRYRRGGDRWLVTRVDGGTSVSWNKAKLEKELGDRVDEFRTEKARAGYTKITREKGEKGDE